MCGWEGEYAHIVLCVWVGGGVRTHSTLCVGGKGVRTHSTLCVGGRGVRTHSTLCVGGRGYAHIVLCVWVGGGVRRHSTCVFAEVVVHYRACRVDQDGWQDSLGLYKYVT